MLLTESDVFKKYALGRKEHSFDFYRCYKCMRVFTREQEWSSLAKMNAQPFGRSGICACGSMKYSPTWPVFWEWLKPGVLRYTLKCVLARGIAPWLERHWQKPLPFVERLVKFKEA